MHEIDTDSGIHPIRVAGLQTSTVQSASNGTFFALQEKDFDFYCVSARNVDLQHKPLPMDLADDINASKIKAWDLNKTPYRFGLPLIGRGIIFRVRLSQPKACAVAR